MHFILGIVAAIFVLNGLCGLLVGSCVAARRKRAGESHWNNLPFVARDSEARFYGVASLALGMFAAFAAFQVASIGGAS